MPATRISGPGLSTGGQRGLRGLKGDKPDYEIDGLSIRWERPDGTLGEWIDLNDVVGFDFRGDWKPTASYEENDLVNWGESVYNARRGSVGAQPDQSPDDWKLFVRGGTVGDGAVTTPKYADGSVTEGKLAPTTASFTLAAPRPIRSRLDEEVYMRDFSGADPFARLKNAADYVSSVGGGKIMLPVCPESDPLVLDGTFVLLAAQSGVHLQGRSIHSTVLKLGNGVNTGPQIAGAKGFGLFDLTLDGNRDNNINAHGFRVGNGGAQDLTLERVRIRQSSGYGLGLQVGTLDGLRVRDLIIEDTGLDGFDFKNLEDDNDNLFLDGVLVRRWGLNAAIASAQAAVDFRGPVHASRINVRGLGTPGTNGRVGIRFREGEANDPSGLGAHYTTLSQFKIEGVPTTDLDIIGLSVMAYRAKIGKGRIVGGGAGVNVHQAFNRLEQLEVFGAHRGFHLVGGSSLPTRGERTQLNQCAAENCTEDGLRVDTERNDIVSFRSRGNATGVRWAAVVGNKMLGGEVSNNATQMVGYNPGSQRIRDVEGWATEASVTSVTIAVDSTAATAQTVTVPHGLQFAPRLEKITATLVRETAVNDFAGVVRIDTVDATNVTIRLVLMSRSSTAGSTTRINVRIDP